jgi:hypothetical protein
MDPDYPHGILAEAMALPRDVRAAAEAIELSETFRRQFSPAHPLGSLHPAAAEFARLAIEVARPFIIAEAVAAEIAEANGDGA